MQHQIRQRRGTMEYILFKKKVIVDEEILVTQKSSKLGFFVK